MDDSVFMEWIVRVLFGFRIVKNAFVGDGALVRTAVRVVFMTVCRTMIRAIVTGQRQQQ
jgi:hypothetical protein